MYKPILLPLLAGIILLVSSCQTTITSIEDSPFYVIPTGSILKLNQEIIFAPNKVAVFIQYAKIKTQWEIDKFSAHCKFELLEKKSSAQVIKPDTFIIQRSNFDTIGTHRQPATLASLDVAGLLHTEAGLTFVDFSVFLYLKSESHKNVYRLTCINWDDPHGGEYLSVNEIRGILGSIMTLHINDPQAKPLKQEEPDAETH